MMKLRRTATRAIAAAGIIAALSGCRDGITAPTQGFIEVDTGDVDEVEIYVDGESHGFAVDGLIGPLAEGTHVVRAVRECYESVRGDVTVVVRPAETTAVDFVLEPREFGAAAVSAHDEMRGFEVTGAEILRQQGGSFVSTGQVTPATIDNLPCGTTAFQVRADGYPTARLDVRIDTGVLTDASFPLAPFRKVLGEMFTYQLCPNCPESSEELKAVQAARPGRFFVVEWHTWDFPHFDLFDPRWKAREDAYTDGVPPEYPGVVVQGGYADDPRILGGSRHTELEQYSERADAYLIECEADCDYALIAEGPVSEGSIDITARVKWRGGNPRSGLKVRFVLIENEVDALGIGSPFYYVPRNYHEEAVSFTSPGEILEIPFSFSVDPGWEPSHLYYVVYLQSDATLEVLAVDGTS